MNLLLYIAQTARQIGGSYKKRNMNDLDKFCSLRTLNDLIDFFQGRANKHGKKYFHYTSVWAANKILTEGLLVFPSGGFNDKTDHDDKNNEFCFCLATGDEENLPLWYFYAGVDGCGCRIKFTETKIRKIMNESEYILCIVNNKKEVVEEVATLQKGKNLKVDFRDVLYYKIVGNVVILKYNNRVINDFPIEEFNISEIEKHVALKSLIWYYEKETRIIFTLKGQFPKEDYAIKIKTPEKFFNDINITFAPEVDEKKFDKYREAYPKINELFLKTSKVKFSQYKGTVKMGLLEKLEEYQKTHKESIGNNA